MKKFLFALCVIFPITILTGTANAQTVDPTYTAAGKTDQNGLTDNYIYQFADGEKDAAPGDCLLMINGQFTNADVIINNNRSFAPIRAVAEAFGANVRWNGDTQTVSIASGNNVITMRIGQTKAVVNVESVPLDAPPVIVGGSTYVPLRFISESLNKTVGYLPASQRTSAEYLDSIPDSGAAKGLAYNPVVWIDDPIKTNNGNPSGDTLAWLKTQMSQGLASLKNNINTADKGNLKGTDPNAPAFTQIQNNIDNAYYIGNAGRYAMYQGPYITLLDKETGGIYFYTMAHELCGVWKADMNDPDTFVPMYFAD